MNYYEFLLEILLSPEHLSKHPHELLNAEFLKNLLWEPEGFDQSGLRILQKQHLVSSFILNFLFKINHLTTTSEPEI